MSLRRRRPGLVYPTWEDWIYVGSGGSAPAFGTDWTNGGSPWPALAFRHREAGVVDIIGVVSAGAGSSAAALFTLPTGYRPVDQAFMPFIRNRSSVKSGQLLIVNDTGAVVPADSTSGDFVYISGSFFLDTAAP